MGPACHGLTRNTRCRNAAAEGKKAARRRGGAVGVESSCGVEGLGGAEQIVDSNGKISLDILLEYNTLMCGSSM